MRRTQETGFTLMELLITTGIIGIIAAVALPQYQRVVDRNLWRYARDTLKTIYVNEQTYWAKYSTYVNASAWLTSDWNRIYMDNPNTNNAETKVLFFVEGATPTTFVATAYNFKLQGTRPCMSIDQTGMPKTTSSSSQCTAPWPEP